MEQPLYELPEGWVWKSLNDISSRITDGTHHSPKTQHDEPASNRFKYITSKHVKNDGLKLENITYVDSDIHEEIYARCNPEYLDQLITKDGAMTGTCCLNTLEEPFSMLSSVALIKQKRDVVQPDFLNHYLQSPTGQEQLLGDISGAAITRTNLKKLKMVPVPFPPLNEQKRIVAKLDALFTRIDAAITHLQETFELSKALFASALDEVFSSSNKQAGWAVTYLPEIVTNGKHSIKRGPFGSALKKAFFVPSGYKVYEQKHAINNNFDIGEYYIDDEKYEELRAFAVAPGDLIMSCSGTVGKIAEVPSSAEPGIINQALLKISIDRNVMNVEFFKYFIRNYVGGGQLDDKVKGAAIKNIASVKELKTIPIPLPDLQEQDEVVDHLDALAEHTCTLEAETQERLDQLTNLKSSLLDAAFRGQL